MIGPVVIACVAFGSGVAILWPADSRYRCSVFVPATTTSADRPKQRWIAGVGCVALCSFAVGFVPAIAVGGGVAGGSWWRSRMRRANRQRLIEDALPETIDVLAVVLGAGGTTSSCLTVLAHRGPVAIRSAVEAAQRQRAAGEALVRCLESIVDQLGSSYRPAIRVLVATERDGAPVSVLLERLADESRSARRRHMEARARRLPVLLLGPLVACFLPAVVVGTIVPLVFVSIERLAG